MNIHGVCSSRERPGVLVVHREVGQHIVGSIPDSPTLNFCLWYCECQHNIQHLGAEIGWTCSVKNIENAFFEV